MSKARSVRMATAVSSPETAVVEIVPPEARPTISTHMLPEGTPEAVLRLMSGPVGEAIAEAVDYCDAALAPAARHGY